MAEVFLATSFGPSGFKKRLVIKRLLPHLEASPRFTKMFLEEARVAALLDHPHLAQVWGCGENDGRHYLAMEYIDGATLAELLRVHRAFDPRIAVAVAIDLLDALHAVHTLELVHRDVTPRNVMITRGGVVKLLDFGIAVPRGVAGASVMGTLRYMSPEQLLNAPLDARSDLYSVGLLLYALIAGRSPFEGGERGAVARPPEMPVELWAIVERALAIEVVDRYTTARQMAAALEALFEVWVWRDRVRPGRARLADLVAIARPSFARQALTRVTRMTRLTRSVAAPAPDAPIEPIEPIEAIEPIEPTVAEPRRRKTWALVIAGVVASFAFGVSASSIGETPMPELAPELVRSPVVVARFVPEPELELAPMPPPVIKKRSVKVAKRERKAPGFLSIDARPWAEVYVDGRNIGTTPLERIEVKSGVRRVVLKNAQYGIDVDLEVVVRPEQVSAIKKIFPLR